MRVERLPHNPIITPRSSSSLGININGPSLVRVPDWVTEPLGRYYLYFAHHQGKSIRLAFAEDVAGPWQIHEPGALALEDSLFPTEIHEADLPDALKAQLPAIRDAGGEDPLYTHIASPDVMVNAQEKQIRLYYHGRLEDGSQASRVAVSEDGLHFDARSEVIANPYLRMFQWRDAYYGMAMPGVFYRTPNGLSRFERGPRLFNRNMRHAALMLRGDTLHVFWTQVGDAPERILHTTVALNEDWETWEESPPADLIRPETAWEGADLASRPSVRGAILEPANELRDPAIFEEDGKVWLLYSIAGESGIAIGRLYE